MNMKTDFFSLHTHSLISISSCAYMYIYIYDRLKIPIHAFTYFDRKRKKCQADGSVRRRLSNIDIYIVSFYSNNSHDDSFH
jgi:hypothetical protein